MINTSATASYTLSIDQRQLQLHLQRLPCIDKITILSILITMPIVVPVGIILHCGNGRSLSKRGVIVLPAAHI